MRQFVIYYRVSTTKQGDSGLGLEAQQRDCSVYLDNYERDPQVLAEYTEVKSGKALKNRPELQKALRHCRQTGATLLVAKLDRLSRDVHDITGLQKDRDLDFIVAQIPRADKMMLQIYAVMAEAERDFIAARTKAALGVVKAKGVPLGTHNPRVAAAKERRKADALAYAETLRPVIADLRFLGLNNSKISAHLNAMGIPSATGKQWHPQTVTRVVQRLGL
jgi:DNA invertase Pin-like site-specific DNA recombinase